MSEPADSSLSGAKGADVDQGRDVRVGACFGDDGAAVGVADQHDRAVLGVEDPPGGGGVAVQGQGRVLHDADPESVAGERFVDALPAGAVNEAAVDENDVP